MKKLKVFTLLAVVILVVGALPSFAQDAPDPLSETVYLTFDKSAITEGSWEGTVGGDIEGNLATRVTSIEMVGPVGFVEFEWIVEAGDQSFTAHLKGTLNTLTGTVVMAGEVVEGYRVGALVYEQGQQAVASSGRFQGTILLLPASELVTGDCEQELSKYAAKHTVNQYNYPCL